MLRSVRRLPQRAAHPVRRRRAERLVAGLGPAPSVLFLCLGNICRSPFAEGVLRKLRTGSRRAAVDGSQGDPRLTSAGFIQPGRPSPPEAQRAAARRGVDLSAHRSRMVTLESLGRHDLTVVMDPRHRLRLRDGPGSLSPDAVLVLGDLDPEAVPMRTIPDPVERPREVFEACYDRIERCVGRLHHLTAAPGPRG